MLITNHHNNNINNNKTQEPFGINYSYFDIYLFFDGPCVMICNVCVCILRICVRLRECIFCGGHRYILTQHQQHQ